ncbi:hypothetical protein JTE90_022550, partial [Oedothorax gibbosus]
MKNQTILTSNATIRGVVSPTTSAQPRISLATNSISVVPNTTGILATPSTHRCVTCHKTYIHKFHLKRHMKTHEATKKAESSTGYILTTSSPAASPDLIEPTTVHRCPTCDKSFAQKFNLMRHMKSHAGGSIGFECKVCDKFFTREDNLIRHAKTHENEEYVCPKCPKTFTRKDALTRHLATHNKP